MNGFSLLFAMLKADLLERTRRSSFLVTLCLVLYIGYAVNSGQILIKLGSYRGLYNSAWVGSLMALVITFLLGLLGFFLVKDGLTRDERTGVGQLLATTAITRPQYLLAKWLSNCTLLATLVAILALAALFMQLVQGEDPHIRPWALLAPFLFIALPVMALVAALAVFFETLRPLKGGFGNLVYFFVFAGLLFAGVQLAEAPWLDAIGLNLVGSHMRQAARAAFPDYNDTFTLAMISGQPLQGFAWPGLNWTAGLIAQRLLWLPVSLGIVLLGSLFFNRFDAYPAAPARRRFWPFYKPRPNESGPLPVEPPVATLRVAQLTPLPGQSGSRFNFLRLTWLEFLLLVKGQPWYWLAGMAALWLASFAAPSESLRGFGFMLVAIWPVLVWSQMGGREARYSAEPLIFPAAHSALRLLAASWLAGVLFTALAAGGVLLGRLVFAPASLALLPWVLSVLFIPTLALALGVWSRGSKLFEVVYPILWYLGPFNPNPQLAVIDHLGIHPAAPVHTAPLLFAGLIAALLLLAYAGRRWRPPLS